MGGNTADYVRPHISGGKFISKQPKGMTWTEAEVVSAKQTQDSEVAVLHRLKAQLARGDDTYPMAAYWRNVEALLEAKKQTLLREKEILRIRNEERIKNGLEPESEKNTANIRDLFEECIKEVEEHFSPMGLTSPDGRLFRLVVPSGKIGDGFLDHLVDVAAMIGVGMQRYAAYAEERVSASNILPFPCHVSPLLLIMIRAKEECHKFSDACTVLFRLRVVRRMIEELDTAEPDHKEVCKKLGRIVMEHVSKKYYDKIDALVEEYDKAREKRDRDALSNVINAFARVSFEYAISSIHAQEWIICEMLKLPRAARPGLFTPRMTGDAKIMHPGDFTVLRTALSNYLQNRNSVYCGMWSEEPDPKTGKCTYLGQAKDTWSPMNLKEPVPLDQRLLYLAAYKDEYFKPQEGKEEPLIKWAPGKIVFGLWDNWIDKHTLLEYMLLFSKDKRYDPVKAEAMRQQRVAEAKDPEGKMSRHANATVNPDPAALVDQGQPQEMEMSDSEASVSDADMDDDDRQFEE